MTYENWFDRLKAGNLSEDAAQMHGDWTVEREALLRENEELQVAKYPGCKILSLGDACTCKICTLERLILRERRHGVWMKRKRDRWRSYAKAQTENLEACRTMLDEAEQRAQAMERAGAEQARRADENQVWAQAAEAELAAIDSLLARRTAIDELPTRLEKIKKTLEYAGKHEAAEARVKRLEDGIDRMMQTASRGHVPDDVFYVLARIREGALSPQAPQEVRREG